MAPVDPYTKTNLRELPNAAEQFGVEGMEARFARTPLGSEKSGVSLQRIAPNERQRFGHRHADQEETYVVVSGSGRVKLEDEVVDLRQWDALRVRAGTMRCFEGGPDGLEYVAFGAGRGGREECEVVPGWWSD
jgi:mannose-6-phosphate isomerase-like protein (cupin superfamily)